MTLYFQVFAWVEGDTTAPSISMLDKDEKFVRKSFVRAYKRGRKIYLDGKIEDLSKVSKVAIYTTTSSIHDLVEQDDAKYMRDMEEFNASSRDVTFIGLANTEPWDSAVEHGQAVTKDFIRQPPGDTSGFEHIFNHPWISSIGTGVILLLLAALFGLG